MKITKIITALLLVMGLFSATAVEYHKRSHSEKMRSFTKAGGWKDNDKTFHLTFDNLTLNSTFAFGSGKAQGVSDINLALRGVPGFDTGNAYRAEPEENLKYSAVGNINPHNGTLIFWTCGLDYAPGDRLTNGKKRTNMALADLRFGNGKEHISIRIYEFNGYLAAMWSSSAAPEAKGYGSIALCETRIDFPRNQWYQIALTWTPEHFAFYVNGKLRAKSSMPPKIKLTSNLRMKHNDSYIGIRSKFYDDDHSLATGIDDVIVLKRALTEIEVGNAYGKLVKGGSGEFKAFTVDLNGVEDCSGKIDKLEAVFDLSGLDNAERELLSQGKLPIVHKLTAPDGKVISSGKLAVNRSGYVHIFNNADQAGKYVLEVNAGKHVGKFEVTRPDFSFLNNKIGEENTVPEVFKAFAVDGRKVTLWGRIYNFGAGPLPENIEVFGKKLLTKAPKLSLDDRKISWQEGKTVKTPVSVTYTGVGKAKDCTINYKTTVEYDGLIRLEFSVNGKPVVNSMRLDWQVRKDAAEFLLTPALKPAGEYSFTFPVSKLDSQIWLVGDGTGGFCWTAENDANWVYGPREKILSGDTASGKCFVKMITQKVQIPEDTQYTSLFIATPTRPLKIRRRFNAYGAGGRYSQSITYTGADKSSGAYTGVFNLRPSEHAGLFWDKVRDKSLRPYNAADSGTVVMPEAVYLRKYGEIPGEYCYMMPYWKVIDSKGTQKLERQPSISFCNRTFITDYLMYNNKLLLDSKWGNKIGQFNYDLAANTLCANTHHKCGFTDRFGRHIRTFVVLSKRKLVERTIRLGHPRGVTVSLHAQNRFCPVIHSMGDSWHPGEQHCAALKTNPFALIDGSVDERLFRSEYNSEVIGTGIVMSLAIAQLNRKNYDIPEATVAAMTMMLLYDIDFARGWTAWRPLFKVWDTFQKYDFGNVSVKAHKFYRQKEVKSNNSEVLITWYECPGKNKLFVLGNRTKQPQKAVIDFGSTLLENAKIREEFFGKNLQLKEGKVEVTVPARAFLLIGTKSGK